MNNKNDQNEGIFKYLNFLLGEQRRELPKLIFFFLILSLLDALGISLIGPYVSLVIDPGLFREKLSLTGIDYRDNFSDYELQIYFSIGIITMFFLKSLFGIYILWLVASFSYRQQVSLRSRLMYVYQSMQYIEYVGRNSSEYIYSIQTLASQYTGKVLMLGLKTISDLLIVIAIILVLAYSSPILLIILLSLLAIVTLTFDRTLKNSIQKYGKKANIASTTMLKGLNEGIKGMKEIRILGAERHFFHAVKNGAKEYANNAKKTDVFSTVPRYLIEFLVIAFLALMVIQELLTNGSIDQLIPILAMFGVASLRLVPAIASITTGVLQFRNQKHTLFLLYQDMKRTQYSDTPDIKEVDKDYNQDLFEHMNISNVSYKYSSDVSYAIEDISLELKRGESIGIIGPSGSGKTTLVDIALGLLEPQKGKILVNDKDIHDDLTILQTEFAYIPQEIFIIDDSLKNNIALGIDDSKIDDDLLLDVVKKTRLSELVEELPFGLQTELGEHGVRLSGGQRQRVAIARALYHKRSVLIMDEATSALDTQTEREIVDSIKMLKGNTTMIVIAHRINTLEHCDRIYELNKGKISRVTTYDSLEDNTS